MTATAKGKCSGSAKVLYLAMELGARSWKLGFTNGAGQRPRIVEIEAGDLSAFRAAIIEARLRFGLPARTRVLSCYEAGRDGFWIHRFLQAQGVENLVVDSSSIEVNRRARRAKSDGLDVGKLVTMLMRYERGERKVWSVLRVPSVEEEDARQLHRAVQDAQRERTRYSNRIRGLLTLHGVDISIDRDFPDTLQRIRQANGQPLPPGVVRRVRCEWERYKLVDEQISEMEREQRRRIAQSPSAQTEKIRTLLQLRGVGVKGASVLVHELFGWRKFANRREVGASAGLAPTPYHSGTSQREQGISRAGNRRVRRMLVQLAWLWLGFQPESDLSRWYRKRFAAAGVRARKVGIVAVARKLLIAFWKFAEQGEIPQGAELVPWQKKLGFACSE